ncbi:MAG: hypothetical protein AAFP79_00625 [Pseudomonadota bacterium]
MNDLSHEEPKALSVYTWFIVAIAGLVAPVIALLFFGELMGPVPLISIGLMGAGIIGAAVAGRFWIGVLLAIAAAMALLAYTQAIGALPFAYSAALGLAVFVASVSFAIRGALFARSAQDKGWWIALFVVAGEAAILITAAARPGDLPLWLLALLPAQWTNLAIQASLTAGDLDAAMAPLIALTGTAAATALVARLWPRRWPYAIMFSTWIALSALVYHA